MEAALGRSHKSFFTNRVPIEMVNINSDLQFMYQAGNDAVKPEISS